MELFFQEDELLPEDKKETGKVFVQIQKLGPRDTFVSRNL